MIGEFGKAILLGIAPLLQLQLHEVKRLIAERWVGFRAINFDLPSVEAPFRQGAKARAYQCISIEALRLLVKLQFKEKLFGQVGTATSLTRAADRPCKMLTPDLNY